MEFYGWDGDRLAFTQSEENQWHVIYEPESFTPLLQLQQPTDTPISEQDKVLAEVMGSLQSTLDYLPGHEAYELSRSVREQTIAQLKGNEQWQTPQLPEECYFYHCNHLGLPEALTNQNGEAVWAASYDAWGNVKEERNPNHLHQPIRLPGQYHDKETDLYYNRHRYYDPKLGNYINQDPIGLASGEPNLTVYPRNPVQWIDPLGLDWIGDVQGMPGPDWQSIGIYQEPKPIGSLSSEASKNLCELLEQNDWCADCSLHPAKEARKEVGGNGRNDWHNPVKRQVENFLVGAVGLPESDFTAYGGIGFHQFIVKPLKRLRGRSSSISWDAFTAEVSGRNRKNYTKDDWREACGK